MFNSIHPKMNTALSEKDTYETMEKDIGSAVNVKCKKNQTQTLVH